MFTGCSKRGEPMRAGASPGKVAPVSGAPFGPGAPTAANAAPSAARPPWDVYGFVQDTAVHTETRPENDRAGVGGTRMAGQRRVGEPRLHRVRGTLRGHERHRDFDERDNRCGDCDRRFARHCSLAGSLGNTVDYTQQSRVADLDHRRQGFFINTIGKF